MFLEQSSNETRTKRKQFNKKGCKCVHGNSHGISFSKRGKDFNNYRKTVLQKNRNIIGFNERVGLFSKRQDPANYILLINKYLVHRKIN